MLAPGASFFEERAAAAPTRWYEIAGILPAIARHVLSQLATLGEITGNDGTPNKLAARSSAPAARS